MNRHNLTRSNQTIDLNSIVASNKCIYFGITTLGIILNSLKIIVLRSGKLNDKTFKYFLVISVADLGYMSIFNVDSLLKILQIKHSFIEQLFQLCFINYLTSCLAMFVLLVDLVNSLNRCFICRNKYYFQKLSIQKVLTVFIVFSMIVYMPEILSKEIVFNQNKLIYDLVSTNWGKSKAGRIVIASIWATRIFLCSFILTVVNLNTAVLLVKRKSLKLKKNFKMASNESILNLFKYDDEIINRTFD